MVGELGIGLAISLQQFLLPLGHGERHPILLLPISLLQGERAHEERLPAMADVLGVRWG